MVQQRFNFLTKKGLINDGEKMTLSESVTKNYYKNPTYRYTVSFSKRLDSDPNLDLYKNLKETKDQAEQ